MASRKKEKYDLILEASLKVIAENGYHGSQISKIAKEAGIADGTIYLYFKNKEDILISLFRQRLGYLINKFKTSIQDTDSADEAIRKICTIHYTEFAQNVNLAYVTQIELRQSSLELRQEIGVAVKPYFQLIENIVQKGIDEHTFRSDLNTKLIRHLLFGAMDEVVTSWLISGMKFSLTAQIDNTVEFFLKGMK